MPYAWCSRLEEADAASDVANLRKRNYVRPAPQKIAITNVHVFDGYTYNNETSTVVIDGSFIGKDATNATIVDGKGGFLMPGLIDSHTHTLAIADLQNLTYYGATTTMCMSCWAATDLCASLCNQPGLTDVYSSGYSAVVPNASHAKLAMSNPAVDAPAYFIYNTSMTVNWTYDRINTGSDFIKLVAEAYPPSMSQDEHNSIVKTAQDAGYWTATHASTLDAYTMAVNSGTNFIQHTPADGNLTDETIAQIVQKGLHVTPTVNIYQYSQAAQVSLDLTDDELTVINYTIGNNVKRMYDAGVTILTGTDSSINSNGPATVYFGYSLHQELKILSNFGVKNIDVLKGATSNAANAYNLLDRGAIAPGLRADLVLINGNPLEDMKQIDNIEKVWVAGEEYTGGKAIDPGSF